MNIGKIQDIEKPVIDLKTFKRDLVDIYNNAIKASQANKLRAT